MKILAKILLVATACLVLPGCAVTNITSEPEGAEIWINDKFVGVTPISDYKVPQEVGHINRYKFKAFLEGYEIMTKTFYESPTMNVMGVIPKRIHFKLVPKENDQRTSEPETPDR